MTRLFTIHKFNEETPVQYVGVYVLAWRGEWGEPTALFAEVDDPVYDAAPILLEACHKALDGMYDQCPQYETMSNKEMRHPDMDCYAVEVILDVRAAIAKAEGEQ